MGLDIRCKCGAIDFRAGSYTGYNRWRAVLAKFAGIQDLKAFWIKAGGIENRKGKEPFFELINFSDCEGVISHKECKRLLHDFDRLAKKLQRKDRSALFWAKLFQGLKISDEELENWIRKFKQWYEAIRHATGSGCTIVFC